MQRHVSVSSLPQDLDGQLQYSAADMAKKLRNYDPISSTKHKVDDLVYDLYDDVVRYILCIRSGDMFSLWFVTC